MTNHPNRSRRVRTLRRAEELRDPQPANMLELWIAQMQRLGHSLTTMLTEANAAAGTAVSLSRLGEIRRGKDGRQLPAALERYIRRCVIGHALDVSGVLPGADLAVPDEDLDRLAELLS